MESDASLGCANKIFERDIEGIMIIWDTKFQELGERILPPPPMLDLDPIIPSYIKFGNEGHLYIVKPPGQDPDEFIFKIGSTTQLLKRMYWYEPGTELLYSKFTETHRTQVDPEDQERPQVQARQGTRILQWVMERCH